VWGPLVGARIGWPGRHCRRARAIKAPRSDRPPCPKLLPCPSAPRRQHCPSVACRCCLSTPRQVSRATGRRHRLHADAAAQPSSVSLRRSPPSRLFGAQTLSSERPCRHCQPSPVRSLTHQHLKRAPPSRPVLSLAMPSV
jgi:hypothetical protein